MTSNYKVADISLAAFGRKEIEIAEVSEGIAVVIRVPCPPCSTKRNAHRYWVETW